LRSARASTPNLQVENTYLSGAILGMGKQKITRKFDEIVSFAGLEKFADTAVLEPEILLVDAVLAVGDLKFLYEGI
jgi:lipopolysaccharide transport system ATP-binding protein